MKVRFSLLFLLLFFNCAALRVYAQEPGEISALRFCGLTVEGGPSTRLSFVVETKRADILEPVIDVEKAAKKSLEYFFLGLAFSDDKFWVNLNPEKSESVVDAKLAATDLGRIMLAADLRLKKDISELTNPRTSAAGRQYWERLYDKAEALGIPDRIPIFNRVWIIPQEVVVEEAPNRISIIESSFRISLESEYLGQDGSKKEARQKELQEYGRQLINELILPALNRMVNESYLYSDLRQVYHSLILARWYKMHFSRGDRALENTAASVLADLDTDLPYGHDQIYRDYLDSLKKGEYDFTDDKRTKLQTYLQLFTRRYLSGGIDLRAIKTTASPKAKSFTEKAKETVAYLLDLYLSGNIGMSLGLAKEQARLTVKKDTVFQKPKISWEKEMPAVAPWKTAKNSRQQHIIERIILSGL